MIYWRTDDFPNSGKDQHLFNLEEFKKFDEVMCRHKINYVLGCIPLYTTDEDLEWLKKQRHIEVAIHGEKHPRGRNEFEIWQTEREIADILLNRKKLWQFKLGCTVDKYIPPNNIIDTKTINALIYSGFTATFGGPETDSLVPEYSKHQGLDFHLSQFPVEYGVSKELIERGSIEHVYRECTKRDIWLTLHWTWEKSFSDGKYHYLDTYLKELAPAINTKEY